MSGIMIRRHPPVRAAARTQTGGRITAALAVTLATSTMVRAEEAMAPPPGRGEKPPKPLCRVEITDTDGLPLAPMSLVSFEEGVYRLRTKDGREIEVAEEDVGSVRFMPLSKPRHDKRPPAQPDGERGDNRWRPKGHDRREGPLARRMKEEREKLLRLKNSGNLGREIEARKARLRNANSAVEAAALIRWIVTAKTVGNGAAPSDREIATIVATIGKSEIRERMKNVPAKYFRQPVGPRGPRR